MITAQKIFHVIEFIIVFCRVPIVDMSKDIGARRPRFSLV